jgi:two-component system cell cycle response regulator
MSVFNINNIPKAPREAVDKPLIMLIDDEVENINVLRRLLSNSYQIVTSLSAQDALEHINTMSSPHKIQLIISDQRMPGMSGVEFFEQTLDKIPDTVRIILTGYSDTQAIIDAVNKAKLYQFITKPFNPGELTLTVKRGIEAFRMKQQLHEYTHNLERKIQERTKELELKNKVLNETMAQLEKVSTTDQLTGSYNRYFASQFIKDIQVKIKVAQANDPSEEAPRIGILCINADHFNAINLKHGHQAGDKVLIRLIKLLNTSCHNNDKVIRWTGEQFLVFSPFVRQSQLQQLANKITANFARYVHQLDSGQSIHCSCSIGISALPFVKAQPDALSWEQTLSLAELALSCAKDNGRNGWFNLYENDQTNADSCYLQATADLPKLIKQGQLSCASSVDETSVQPAQSPILE